MKFHPAARTSSKRVRRRANDEVSEPGGPATKHRKANVGKVEVSQPPKVSTKENDN